MSFLKTFHTEVVSFPKFGSNLKDKQSKKLMPDDQANQYAEKHNLAFLAMQPGVSASRIQADSGEFGTRYIHLLTVEFGSPAEAFEKAGGAPVPVAQDVPAMPAVAGVDMGSLTPDD